MNNEQEKRLATALRSGNYLQGKGRLKKGDKFCCLGVACDVFKDEVGGKWDGDYFLTAKSTVDSDLPIELSKLLSVSRAGRLYKQPIQIDEWQESNISLAVLNDNDVSFLDIADIIESGNVEII